jgi:hypothetical protein
MLRSTASKMMWLGRTTSAVVGLAILLALAIGAANSALAHTNVDNKLFHLDHNNNVTTALTKLTGNLTSQVLKIDNNGTGPALSLEVGNATTPANNVAPMRVNSNKVVTNFNADQLDGNNSTAFLPSEIYSKSVTQSIPANNFDNGITLYCDRRDVAVSGSYRIAKPGAYLQVFGEERVDERFDEEQQVLNPSAWHVYVDNPDAENEGSITVFVHCADRPPLRTAPGP